MSSKPDDLEAVRTIVSTLSAFDSGEQERIIRWSREKLGLPVQVSGSASTKAQGTFDTLDAAAAEAPDSRKHVTATDIKSFIAEKAPSSDNQFAAAVAYYYRFEAPEAARKDTITSEDLQEACRLAGRARVARPAQTLINAHGVGLLDKAGDRGAYAISTVGENLVAMTLPGSAAGTPRPGRRSTTKSSGKKGSGKKSSKKGSGKKSGKKSKA
jgi:hypothetical protein